MGDGQSVGSGAEVEVELGGKCGQAGHSWLCALTRRLSLLQLLPGPQGFVYMTSRDTHAALD